MAQDSGVASGWGGASFRGATSGSILTRKDARALSLEIPAPRGMILDRHGEVFAQNRVVYRVSLQYQQFEKADRDFVVNWGRKRLRELAPLVEGLAELSDDALYQHYRHRRWLPMFVTGEIDPERAAGLKPRLPAGIVLTPVYSRHYPHRELAAHVIGYSGSIGQLPTGPINYGDPLWVGLEGRAGLEKLFDEQLAGEPGLKRVIFDEHGNKLLEELVKRPKPGGNLVTTLDLKWQQAAEDVLREGCERGALVMLDAITGEVLVMASRPSFDLNAFIPRISARAFKALNEDPSNPLYGRAYQSAYPPASTFKPVVSLAALQDGAVTAETLIDCPVSIEVGDVVFSNWAEEPEGEINVIRAIARSCNTWFYQVAIDLGAKPFIDLARRLGYGQKTGLPVIGETPGILPDNDWMMKHEGRPILDGDTANLSIGQGSMLASPLQVAQAMAGIANGEFLPELLMVSQIQDRHGRVVKAASPKPRNPLGLSPYAVQVTRIGMSDVVNAAGGTGLGAQLSYAQLCGKTGTAQWGPESKNQRLGWFAGFVPEENPRFAFAVLYEGKPNEKVSGGRLAAPMARKFFEAIKEDIQDTIAPPKKAMVVFGPDEEGAIPAAIPIPEGDLFSSPPAGPTEGFLHHGGDRPLRHGGVRPLRVGDQPGAVTLPVDPAAPVAPPLGDLPLKAIPVLPGGEEVINPPTAIPVYEPGLPATGTIETPPAAIPVYEPDAGIVPEEIPPAAVPVAEPVTDQP